MTKAIIPGKLLLRNAYRLLKLGLPARTRQPHEGRPNLVVSLTGVLERSPGQNEAGRSSASYRRITNGMGKSSQWKAGSRLLGQTNSTNAFKLPRAFGHPPRHKGLRARPEGKNCPSVIRQRRGRVLHQPSGWPQPQSHSPGFELEIALSAKHLAGKENVHADHLSRLSTHYEWQLHPRLFKFLDRIWGPHTIDRFASFTNTHLPLYNSLYFDTGSGGLDALAQLDWADHNNFVNAPFRLIPRIVRIIREQRADATLLAPWWPAQSWFRELLEMSIRPPLRLPNLKHMFLRSTHTTKPLHNCRWKIYAWRISGKQN